MDDKREERISTSHILVVPKPMEADEQPVVEMLEGLRAEILAGRKFGEVARENSQDLESAKREGYLGWFSLDEMPEDFRAQIKLLKTGEISPPFKTQYGYHIAKLLKQREARPISLKQDWELISQRVLNATRERVYAEWLEKLKERYYIEVKS